MTPDALRAALRSIVASAPAGQVAFGAEFLSDEAGSISRTDDAWAEGGRLDGVLPEPVRPGMENNPARLGVQAFTEPGGTARGIAASRAGGLPGDRPGYASAPDGPPPSGKVGSNTVGDADHARSQAPGMSGFSATPVRAGAAASAPPSGVAIGSGSATRGTTLSSPTPAAVLVPFVLGEPMGVLLTKRTAHLKRHAGQVSFPGGRIDPEDASPEAAALREAQEEIALDPARVEVLGRLPDHITGTGYRITPVVGLLPPGIEYTLSPHEVESIFELPLSVLLDPNAPQLQRQHVNGRWREYWVWPHPDHFIWGATAAILMHLAQQLRQRA